MTEAYIVAGYRTAVGKATKGGFRFTRPDDLAVKGMSLRLMKKRLKICEAMSLL